MVIIKTDFFSMLLAFDMIVWHDVNNNESGIPTSAEAMASI